MTAMADGRLRAWDPLTGASVGQAWDGGGVQTWSLAGAVLDDGTPIVLSGGADGSVHRWDARTGARIWPALDRCGRAVAMTAVRLPDSRSVVCVGSARGRVHRLDVVTGRSVGPSIRTGWEDTPTHERPCPIRMACLATRSGGVVATCADFRTVQLRDLLTGERLGDLPRCAGTKTMTRVMACAWMPDGTPVVLMGDAHGSVRRFHALTGALAGAARCRCTIRSAGGTRKSAHA